MWPRWRREIDGAVIVVAGPAGFRKLRNVSGHATRCAAPIDRRADFPGHLARLKRALDPVPADRLDRAARAAPAAQHRCRAGRGIHPPHRRPLGRRTRSLAACRRWRSSLAREHEWAPGTLSLSIQGMTAVMRDLGREIARALPARNLAIVNGHGGNRGILEALAQDLRADFGLNICVLHPAAWAEIDADAAIPEIHGGKNETSMMLAIAPQLVRQDQIAQLKNPPDGEAVRQVDPRSGGIMAVDDGRQAARRHGRDRRRPGGIGGVRRAYPRSRGRKGWRRPQATLGAAAPCSPLALQDACPRFSGD